MNPKQLEQLLEEVRSSRLSVADAAQRLRSLPFECLEFAHVDHHRQLRQGFPEVVFGAGKSLAQIKAILACLRSRAEHILVTRLEPGKAAELQGFFPEAQYHPDSQVMTLGAQEVPERGRGLILVISAGTSDIPVAEEALVTARVMGNRVEAIYDVGVAGLHRLLAYQDKLQEARVFIVVAGMEGALPSVVGGLVNRPVIAVPTSVGYGASFAGLAALLGMLNSCAANVAVVNIDNGFGAGYLAALINRQE
ncbi:MAG: 1-(5-phosphoribosyl)-5-amino-4-imidazole-carboxylate carboxylase [Desulfobacca sp. 4484_104]|nr:MAG: 1-(5-phosphoribosyl)-5-amino-4-imidazole-carboxylate carboxylase [Desulfobacca sp. 4484_104]RLA90974.1 MAG: nickel pincer cofactor biosynthesis protein LarB [Deltaproteobacteria bacterium]